MSVGVDGSRSTAGCAEPVDVEAAVLLDVAAAELAPGVGLPRRFPLPEKGTYFFFGCL